MTRSLWKGPFSDISSLVFSVFSSEKIEKSEKTQQKIWSRRSVILPQFIGKQFMIYNGKTFIPLKVSPDMVGHKMGEFATTRKKPIHKVKNKKK